MKKLIAKIEDMNFSGREYFLLGVCLLLGGTLLGMLLSPKGERVIGSHNGNNNTGYYNENDADEEESVSGGIGGKGVCDTTDDFQLGK